MECLHPIDRLRSWVKKIYQQYTHHRELIMEHERKDAPLPLTALEYERSVEKNILLEIPEVLKHCKKTPCIMAAAITNLNIGILHMQYNLYGSRILATEYLKKCIDLLEERKLTSEGILPAISANNQLGRIYFGRISYEKAEDFLKKAEDLYVKFTEDIKLDPVYIVTIMGIKEIEGDLCAKSILQKLHMLTLSYFMDVYRDWNNKCFVLYQHKMLSRQWSQNRLTHDLDYVAWIDTATRISQYFLKENKFPQARHHLAAASCILEKYLEILKAKGSRETSDSIAAEYEDYDAKSASIARCWAKYGIALLEESKKRLLKRVEEEDQDSKPAKVSGEICKYPQTETMEDLRFVNLEPELESITDKITDMYLLDFNDAKPVLLNVRKWLDKAAEHYAFKSEIFSWKYKDIAEDLAQDYKYLLFFENDEDRQAGIHKQRIDILEEINEKLYLAGKYWSDWPFVKIWIELAETYSTILDLKMNRLQRNVTPMVQMVAEIERLAKISIKYYQSYFKCLNESKSEFYAIDELASYFHGKLYNKIIISDIEQGIRNTQNSLDTYCFIVYYYDNHPEKQKELEKLGCCRIIKKMRHFVAAYVRQIFK